MFGNMDRGTGNNFGTIFLKTLGNMFSTILILHFLLFPFFILVSVSISNPSFKYLKTYLSFLFLSIFSLFKWFSECCRNVFPGGKGGDKDGKGEGAPTTG